MLIPHLSQLIDFTETPGLCVMNQLFKKMVFSIYGGADGERRLKDTQGV